MRSSVPSYEIASVDYGQGDDIGYVDITIRPEQPVNFIYASIWIEKNMTIKKPLPNELTDTLTLIETLLDSKVKFADSVEYLTVIPGTAPRYRIAGNSNSKLHLVIHDTVINLDALRMVQDVSKMLKTVLIDNGAVGVHVRLNSHEYLNARVDFDYIFKFAGYRFFTSLSIDTNTLVPAYKGMSLYYGVATREIDISDIHNSFSAALKELLLVTRAKSIRRNNAEALKVNQLGSIIGKL